MTTTKVTLRLATFLMIYTSVRYDSGLVEALLVLGMFDEGQAMVDNRERWSQRDKVTQSGTKRKGESNEVISSASVVCYKALHYCLLYNGQQWDSI